MPRPSHAEYEAPAYAAIQHLATRNFLLVLISEYLVTGNKSDKSKCICVEVVRI